MIDFFGRNAREEVTELEGKLEEKEEQLRVMQQQLEEKDRQLGEFTKLTDELFSLKEKATAFFEEEEEERKEMDRTLTRVVDHVHEVEDLASTGDSDVAELSKGLTELSEKLTDYRESVERYYEDLEPEGEDLSAFAAGIKNMGNFFRDISVLSLTAAIDAGRLGENAVKFVGKAEDIRIEAEKREHEIRTLIKALQHMEEQRRKIQLPEGLPEEEEIQQLIRMASALKVKQSGIFEKQKSILDEMEVLGESFMKEQKEAEKTKEIFFGEVEKWQ